MGAKIKGSIKVKADKDYKKGDDIEITDQTFEADQEDFEAALEPRLKRERKKNTETEDALEKATKELEELKKKGDKGGEADEKTAARLAELEETNKRLILEQKIDRAIKKSGVELPAQFRNAITLKSNASDSAIEDAVAEQVKELKEFKKSLGVDDKKNETAEEAEAKKKAAEKPGAGSGQQGAGKPLETPEEKQRLDVLAKKAQQFVPHMVGNLANLDDAGKLEVLTSWDQNKLLEPKAK